MKNICLVFILSLASLATIAQKKKRPAEDKPETRSPKFIEDIEIRPGDSQVKYAVESNPVREISTSKVAHSASGIEGYSAIQFKYAQLLNCNVEFIKNISLYNFIEDWWQTRYRYGGSTKSGVDCSAFTGLLMSSVFGLKLPRTAKDQFAACSKIKTEEMNEGDLVFFNTRGGISHVGLYLGDQYFVHASTTSGVTISRLDDPYYESRFLSAGRVTNATDLVSAGSK